MSQTNYTFSHLKTVVKGSCGILSVDGTGIRMLWQQAIYQEERHQNVENKYVVINHFQKYDFQQQTSHFGMLQFRMSQQKHRQCRAD